MIFTNVRILGFKYNIIVHNINGEAQFESASHKIEIKMGLLPCRVIFFIKSPPSRL